MITGAGGPSTSSGVWVVLIRVTVWLGRGVSVVVEVYSGVWVTLGRRAAVEVRVGVTVSGRGLEIMLCGVIVNMGTKISVSAAAEI